MKKLLTCLMVGCAGIAAHAGENLIPDGTFTDIDEKSIGRVCRGEDGAAKLFTEEGTWNRCCQIETGPARKGEKHTTRTAVASFGKVGETWGFPVKPNTTYEYSVDVRKGSGIGGARAHAVGLNAGDFWSGREKLKTTGGRVTLQDVWSNVRGTFKTGPETKRAVLSVEAWSSTEIPSGLFADGSYFLVDNVRVEESSKNLGAAAAPAEVAVRKAVATGEKFGDFVSLATGKAVSGEMTMVKVTAGETGFLFAVECREAEKLVLGKPDSPWSGDNFELWFGATAEGRVSTQVGVGAGGGLYVTQDGTVSKAHGVTFKVAPFDGGYRAKVMVPYALLSLKGAPTEGTVLPFNVGRFRRTAHAYQTWSPLKTGFSDTANFGTLVVGSYSAALTAKYGAGKTASDRADYEEKVAAEETARLKEKFARFAKQKLAVAPVSPIGDFALPYLPEEIFDPPAEIKLTAAINEKKPLPVAIANLSARVGDYLVLLETIEPTAGERGSLWQWRGKRGLNGFPEDQVTFRKALRMKDVATADPTLRFDPLPETDGCCSLTVAPKEAGLVWFDFDTTGVKPGVYKGRLRVIPTCEAGSFKSLGKGYNDIGYTGEMQVIPVTLEVVDVTLPTRPRRPSGFFQGLRNESCYQLVKDLGFEYALVSPWSFGFPKKSDGSLDLDDAKTLAKATSEITAQLAVARKYNRPIKFLVCYSIVHVFHQIIAKESVDRETRARLFKQYVQGIAKVFASCGLGPEDYTLETYDEPPADKPEEILWFHRLAKEAVPGISLELTLGHRMMKIEELERIGEVTDEWIVWDSYFTTPGYADLFARLKQRGAKVLHYQCDTSPRVPLHDYYRKKTWFGEYWKLDGNCMYQLFDTCGGVGGPDYKACTYGGIIQFVYDRAVPTIRSMAFREGVTDMQYLAALEQATGNNAETRAYVAEAAKRVMQTKKFDAAEPDRIRAEVIRKMSRTTK